MPEMTEREQVLRDLVADLREECAEKDEQIEALKTLLSDIKLFEVDSGVERIKKGEPAFALPLALRKRMQAVLDNAEQTGQ